MKTMTHNSHTELGFGKVLLLIFVPGSPVHAKAMQQIEETLSRNSVMGGIIAILSSTIAQIKSLEVVQSPPTIRQVALDYASEMGVYVGLLIGCLTLAIQSKKFYKEFIIDARRKQKRAKSIKTDSPGRNSKILDKGNKSNDSTEGNK